MGFFIMHIMNGLFNLMCLFGLEKMCCHPFILMFFVFLDVGILIWGQAAYFKSMRFNCMQQLPATYYWLMCEILFFYILSAILICYFFRKHCQDKEIIKEGEKDEREDEEEIVFGQPIPENEIEMALTHADPDMENAWNKNKKK